MKEIEKAIKYVEELLPHLSEVGDISHTHRKAVQTLISLAQKVLDSEDVVDAEDIDEVIKLPFDYALRYASSIRYSIKKIDQKIIRKYIAKSLSDYLSPIITKIQQEKEEMKKKLKELTELLIQQRNIEVICSGCQGWGIKTYGDTSTWMHGIGGQMITFNVCDKCWGSGDEKNPWGSWKEIKDLQSLINSASNELPERKKYTEGEHNLIKLPREGYNQYRKLAIPIFAKKNKRIEELNRLIDFKIKIIDDYRLEVYELKRKIEKLESNLEYPIKEIKELRKKIEDLELRLRRKG